jgi:hypothetical protein
MPEFQLLQQKCDQRLLSAETQLILLLLLLLVTEPCT